MENPFNADSNPCSIEQSNSKTNWLHRADRNDLLKILQTFDLSLETSRKIVSFLLFPTFPYFSSSSKEKRINEPTNERRSFSILEKIDVLLQERQERERSFVQDRILSSDGYNEFQRDLSPREWRPLNAGAKTREC